jgi:hypothetical protein
MHMLLPQEVLHNQHDMLLQLAQQEQQLQSQ